MNQMERAKQIRPYLGHIQKQVTSLLMDESKANKFLAGALQVASDPALFNCSPDSITQALVGVAMADLSIDKNLGHAYLVPYKGQAQLQIGYKGFIQLLERSGWAIKAIAIYKGDRFDMISDGWDSKVIYQPNLDDRDEGNPAWVYKNFVGVYVIARAANGERHSRFVTKSLIEKLRKTSPNQKTSTPTGIWSDWYEEMAIGKAIKKLAKTLPIGDRRVAAAIAADDLQEIGKSVDFIKTADSGIVTEGGEKIDLSTGEVTSSDVQQNADGSIEGEFVHEPQDQQAA